MAKTNYQPAAIASHEVGRLMIGTLDRILLRQGLWRWLLVLFLGTFLVLAVDVVARLGTYVNIIGQRPGRLLLFQLVRIPEFLLTFLPWSTLVAAMLLVGPMLREGTLMALAAAGLAPARTLRATVVLAVLTGWLAFLIADQVVPRLQPLIARLEASMEGRGRDDLVQSATWSTGATRWDCGRAVPSAILYHDLAIFRADRPLMLLADTLVWDGATWELQGVVLVDGATLRTLPTASPQALGLDPLPAPQDLTERLRSDNARTSDELFATHSPRRWAILVERLMGAVLPILCLAFALPRFIKWQDRLRPGVAVVRALVWLLPPLAGGALLPRLVASTGGQPVLIALAIAGALGAVAVLRWRRMAL